MTEEAWQPGRTPKTTKTTKDYNSRNSDRPETQLVSPRNSARALYSLS